MTRDRRRKAEIRAHQAATGTSYLVARRQTTPSLPLPYEDHWADEVDVVWDDARCEWLPTWMDGGGNVHVGPFDDDDDEVAD